MGHRWGLAPEAIRTLGQRLHDFWDRYRSCFKTQTRDGSAYARHYLSGLLRMERNRHSSGIGRETEVPGQNIQHFMSNSPWSAEAVYRQVQEEVKATPELTRGGVLLVDESAAEKASDARAGAAKQDHGRLGKVETSQVGVLLSYVNLTVAAGFWTWITGKLFLPEAGLEPCYKKRREQRGIPESGRFKTQVELAWDGMQAVITGGLPFEMVGFDSWYGRRGWLRAQGRTANPRYMAAVPADTAVYLEKPTLGIPPRQGKRGRKPTPVQGLAGETVRADSRRETMDWQRLRVRATERAVSRAAAGLAPGRRAGQRRSGNATAAARGPSRPAPDSGTGARATTPGKGIGGDRGLTGITKKSRSDLRQGRGRMISPPDRQ